MQTTKKAPLIQGGGPKGGRPVVADGREGMCKDSRLYSCLP